MKSRCSLLPPRRARALLVHTRIGSGLRAKGDMSVLPRHTEVVLIVEDDREMRSLLCDEFWSAGYQLREARDGDEAFQAVLQAVPDLILTDLRMPAGGAEYISRLRTVAPSCPIVVMTAFGDPAVKTAVLEAGADVYFDKPVRVGELKTCVQQLLARPRGSCAAQSSERTTEQTGNARHIK